MTDDSVGASRDNGTGGDGWRRVVDIPVEMTVRLGRRRMRIRELLRLEPNAIVELDRRVDDPMEIVVNGRVIARGEVLVEEDRLAIRILDVLAAADRLQSLT